MSHLEGVVASCEGNGRSVGSRNTYEPMFSVISFKLSICHSLKALNMTYQMTRESSNIHQYATSEHRHSQTWQPKLGQRV